MKKFLALVLALVMTMSLVTISAGAKDFNDAADVTYTEAVDVMSAVGVVDGDLAGNFNPANNLTRGAAAKIICNLILGPTTAAALSADTAPYSDVAVDSTFAGYIAFCQEQGIISGYADGTFKPAAPLTGYAFMKMLLGALGYDVEVEGYTGANWSINVAKRALNIGLNAGLEGTFNGTKEVTREEAMLYAFNAMQATMVEYDTTITIGDITVAGSKAAPVANWGKTDGNIDADDEMQFAEKYFTNLKGIATEDAMERPATEWMLKKDSIGLYADEADYTVFVKADTDEDTLAEVIDEISKKLDESNAAVYVNGKTDLTKDEEAGNKVEIYVDADDVNVIDRIVITHWTVVQLTADPDVTEVEDETYVEIAGIVEYEENVVGYEDLKEDDVVMYYEDNDGVYHFEKADSFVATMTETTEAAKIGSVVTPETYTIAGDKYYLSEQTNTIAQNVLITFEGIDNVTYYLDNDGNIIFAEGEAAPTDLMIVLKNDGYDAGNVFGGVKKTSQVLFVDEAGLVDLVKVYKVGTKELTKDTSSDTKMPVADLNAKSLDVNVANAAPQQVADVNENHENAKFFLYDEGTKGYTLTEVAAAKQTQFWTDVTSGLPTTYNSRYHDGVYTTNSETVYLVRDVDTYAGTVAGNTYEDTFTAYVGYKAVPTMTLAHCIAYVENGVAKYVVVDQYATIENTADDLFYAISDDMTAVYKANSNEVAYYYITGIFDGKIVNLKLNDTAAAAVTALVGEGNSITNRLFNITKYDADNYVDTIALATGNLYYDRMTGTKAASADVVLLDTANTATAFSYTDDTVVYTVNNKILSVGSVDNIVTDANDLVTVVVAKTTAGNAANREAEIVFIQKKAPTAPSVTVDPEAVTGAGDLAVALNAANPAALSVTLTVGDLVCSDDRGTVDAGVVETYYNVYDAKVTVTVMVNGSTHTKTTSIPSTITNVGDIMDYVNANGIPAVGVAAGNSVKAYAELTCVGGDDEVFTFTGESAFLYL